MKTVVAHILASAAGLERPVVVLVAKIQVIEPSAVVVQLVSAADIGAQGLGASTLRKGFDLITESNFS